MKRLLLILFFIPFLTIAQKKAITLEDIYKKGTFRGEYAPGFVNTESDNLFDPKDVVDAQGKSIDTKDYEVSADKKRIVFFNGREPIYRHSSKSTVYVYDIASKKTVLLNNGKV